MQRAFRGVLEGGIGAKYTADELIGHLVDAEWDERHNRRLARLLKGARFRYQASFEQIDFRRARNLDKNLVLRLSDGSWVQEHRNVIVTGPTGVGKSFLCSAIGHQACLHGFKTRYFNCTKFFPQTRLWVADGSYLKQMVIIYLPNPAPGGGRYQRNRVTSRTMCTGAFAGYLGRPCLQRAHRRLRRASRGDRMRRGCPNNYTMGSKWGNQMSERR